MSDARVLLVDDHNLVRSGLRALLDSMEGIRVIGEADAGALALDLVRRDPPDVVIADIQMKGMDGIELAAILAREFPQLRVIILSMHAEEHIVKAALRAGARAYLLKDAAEIELELALRAVLRGETYLSPGVSRQVVQGYVNAGTSALDSLTPRQREVLTLIAEGKSAKEIAYQLDISAKTVEAHRASIMERLQIHDIAGLVKYAISAGLTGLE